MRSFARWIGKLPFIGKVVIRPFIFGLYYSTTRNSRTLSYLQLVMVLLALILGHAAQMKMGFDVIWFNAPTWAKAISVLYAIINACVVLTQGYLVYRTTRFYICTPLPKVEREDHGFTRSQNTMMIAVTVCGQLIFNVLYIQFG